MTLSLVYDGVSSRVRIAGSGLTVSDTFTRTESNGWGTSFTGHAWSTSGGSASDYSTTGTRGRHLLASVGTSRNTFTADDIADVDITVDVVVPQLATGGAIRGGILARRVDGSNYYNARLECKTDQSVTVFLFKVVDGSSTTLGTATIPGEIHTVGDTFSMQFQLVGTTLRVKAFGSVPDPGWLIDVTDSALTSGAVGAQSLLETGNTNISPVVEYDNFLAIPTVKVERTTGPYDNFTRLVSSGWGAATTGHAWSTTGGSTSDYSVTGTKGRMAVGTVTFTRNAVLGSMWDADITVNTIAPVLATGARINVAVLARWQDANNQYSLNASYRTDGTVDLFFLKRVDGFETELDRATNVLTYVPGVSYQMRFQVVGNTLRGKMWAGVEPATWAVEGTANDLPAGAIGLRAWITNGNTNTLPVNLDFDNFTVPWTTVRGGAALIPSNGAVVVDDHEFAPDVCNYYRAVGQDGYGPALNPNMGFEVDTAGWTGQSATIARSTAQAHEGVASLLITPDGVAASGGAIADRVATIPAIVYRASMWVYSPGGWSDLRPAVDWWTALSGGSFISTSLGVGFSVPAGVWTYLEQIFTAPAGANAGQLRARHAGTPTAANTWHIDEAALSPIGITPALDGVWLKSLSNPALNRPVTVRDWSRVRRPNRSGSFVIVGAKLPVAVSEKRGGKQYVLQLRAADPTEAAAIDAILDAGDVILVHVPVASTVPGGYYQVEDSEEEHYKADVPRIRTVNLPLAEHAAPPPEV